VDRKIYILGGVLVLVLILGAAYLVMSPSGPGPSTGKAELVWWKTF